MTPRKFDIWQGPIIGYGDATGLSAGGKFRRPDDVELPYKKKCKKDTSGYTAERNTSIQPKKRKSVPNRKQDKQVVRSPWQELKEANERLAKAERDKKKRIESSARLRYMQSCLMRLGLMLAAFVGDADDFLDTVAAFPFDEGYVVARRDGWVTVKNEKSRTLRLEACCIGNQMSLSLYGGKSYKLHTIEALCSNEYVGTTWRVIDIW